MQWLYLAVLVAVLVCLGLTDYRYKLALWCDATRAIVTLLVAVVLFTFWDVVGIAAGFFRHGNSIYTLPARIMPEFPIEEIFFLLVLCYTTLLLQIGVRRIWPTT